MKQLEDRISEICAAAERNAYQAALLEIARQPLADEMDDHTSETADWEGGYEALVEIARAATRTPVPESGIRKPQP